MSLEDLTDPSELPVAASDTSPHLTGYQDTMNTMSSVQQQAEQAGEKTIEKVVKKAQEVLRPSNERPGGKVEKVRVRASVIRASTPEDLAVNLLLGVLSGAAAAAVGVGCWVLWGRRDAWLAKVAKMCNRIGGKGERKGTKDQAPSGPTTTTTTPATGHYGHAKPPSYPTTPPR